MRRQEKIIRSRTNEELLNDWKEIDSKEVTQEVATVRGWLMHEIKKRWPEEFSNWIEDCENDDITHYIKLN